MASTSRIQQGKQRANYCFNYYETENEGSCARDHLARERNYLAYVKMSVILAVVAVALILRFRFVADPASDKALDVKISYPLGFIFFLFAFFNITHAVFEYFSLSRGLQDHRGFVQSGKFSRTFGFANAALIFAATIVMIVEGGL